MINGKNQLRVAYDDFTKRGYITNFPMSGYRVWLSTNVATIGGTQYQCFAKVDGGWGYDGGKFAMTTTQILIWLDPDRPPKIITMATGHRCFPTVFTMKESPNRTLETNCRPASPRGASRQFRRAMHAQPCVSGGRRSALR